MFLEQVAAEKKDFSFFWKYFAGTVITIIALIVGYLPLGLAIKASNPTLYRIQQFQETMDFELLGIDSNVGLLLVITSFICGLIFLLLVIKFIHKRSIVSVITAQKKIRWARVLYAFVIWIVISACIELTGYFFNPQDYIYNVDYSLFFPLLVISILLLPFQTSFEEIFLRGYLMQGIGLIGVYRFIPVVITSLIFGLLHIANPEINHFGIGAMMVFYISFALVLGIITVMDDGLELPLGIHAANNIYAAVLVSYSGGALQTNSLFKVTTLNIDYMLYLWLVMSFLILILFSKKYNWESWKKIFGKIDFSSGPA